MCGHHIYDVLQRWIPELKKVYHLYIDINNAFNSDTIHAVWASLRAYNLSTELVSSMQRLQKFPPNEPLLNGAF